MKYNVRVKIWYYIKLAVKKPYLILSFLFKRHIGVILIVPIKEIFLGSSKNQIKCIKLTTNVDMIYQFYKSVNRDSVSHSQINEWLDKNYDCFLVYGDALKPIAGMWVFKNNFKLSNTSGRTLARKHEIMLDKDTIYGAYVIVNENHRGCGINQELLSYVISYYLDTSNYKRLLLITGATNGAYIRTVMKLNGILVGITEVYNILGVKIRRELFLDSKEKVWNNNI
ncbi:GNAT family N-acetyltransferase [Brassicibacter mesophilus]|uniref:GNAT family N-acetyltransferase n=1 Tax=Brassicibacter mesophilus TaxID=745119 RepID=UPI003D22CDFB